MRNIPLKKDIENLYLNKNLSVKDICSKLHISTNKFYKVLDLYKIKKRKSKIVIDKESIRLDIKNQKFGRLTAIEPTNKKVRKNIVWIFKCDCGKIIEAQATRVKSGHKSSCGCLHNDVAKSYRLEKNPNWTGYKCIRGAYWSSLKRGAKERNLEFSITIEYAWEIYQKQNGLCKLSNLPIGLDYRDSNKKEKEASLDRIDSSKGYIEGNIQWIHKTINYMKMDLDQKEFIRLCKLIGENNV